MRRPRVSRRRRPRRSVPVRVSACRSNADARLSSRPRSSPARRAPPCRSTCRYNRHSKWRRAPPCGPWRARSSSRFGGFRAAAASSVWSANLGSAARGLMPKNLCIQSARELVADVGRPIGERRHFRRERAGHVGLRELAVGEAHRPPFRLDGAVAQHQMREIDVEFMRRHIGAFRHETHVAERAGVDDRLEILALHRVEFAALGAVDKIEQPRKTIAKVEAAAAGVTNVKHAPHLGVELGFIVKVGALPIDRMPRRGVQTAFPHLKSMFSV